MAILTVGFNPAIDRILECPHFHVGGHQQAQQVARLASGKSANVSRALAQLGVDTIATGFVGNGELEFFHEQLLSTGPGRILCRFVEVAGKTRENVTILDPTQHIETHIRDRGFSVTPAEMELLDRKLAHDLKPGDIVVFSGSLCRGLPDVYFAELLDRCIEQEAKVVVDSNGDPLLAAARKRLWVLKPNLEELGQLLNVDMPNDAQALRDLARPLTARIDHLLISRGSQGALLLTPTQCFTARTRVRTPPVRTVGCGDHLLAGFVGELAAGREPSRALSFAVAVATARALSTRLDAFDPGLLESILPEIEVNEI